MGLREFSQQRETKVIAPQRDLRTFVDGLEQEIESKRKETEKKQPGFFSRLFSEPINLGRTISGILTQQEQEQQLENFLRLNKVLTEKIRNKEIDIDKAVRLHKMLGETKPEIPEGLERSKTQIMGDILGTALWITPFNEIKALKGISILSRAKRGTAIGGAFGVAHGMSEGASPEEIAKKFAIGGAIGAPAEIIAPFVFRGLGKTISSASKGAVKGVEAVGRRVAKITPKPIRKLTRALTADIETRLRLLGPHGAEIAERFNAADERTLRRVGTAISDMEDKGLFNLNERESITVLDALEGRVKSKSLSEKASKVFESLDFFRKEIAQEAQNKGIKIRLKKGVAVPFHPRKNFYPHFAPEIRHLQKGKLREEVIENSIRIGKFKNRADAELALDSYINVVETTGRGDNMDFWVKHLIDTGQAKTRTEAIGKTIRFFKPSRLSRNGHLERSRELDFPFYDPDVRRAFPLYYMSAVQRLERVAEFGVDGRKLDNILGRLKRSIQKELPAEEATASIQELKGDRGLIAKMFGVINDAPSAVQTSLFLRALQIPKLSFAQILNLGQNLNTLLATDMPSLGKGLQLGFTKAGQKEALRSGATLESILRESAQIGDDVPFASMFLKYTGFTWTEKFNRSVAANAGIAYAKQLRNKLLKEPENKTTRRLLEELKLNPNELLQRDFNEEELLNVAQRMSFLTQFRSRPIDLPAFASSPEGKVIFQYKNFIFNQTKFITNQLQKEFKSEDTQRILRTLFILSIAYPMTGEVIADIRSLLTGTKRPRGFLARYWNNLMNTGAVGIWGDMIQSAQFEDLADFFIGPTAGTATEALERLINVSTTQKIRNSDIRFFIRQPGITRPLGNFLFPSESKEWQTILEQLN